MNLEMSFSNGKEMDTLAKLTFDTSFLQAVIIVEENFLAVVSFICLYIYIYT